MLDIGAPGRLLFKLLGQPAIASGDRDPVRISAQKGLALLAYLAMRQGASVNRAILADLLWSDRAEAQARQNLRQLILTLRRDLGPRHVALLQADDQSISLTAEIATVDAVQFEAWAKNSDPAVRARCLELSWGSFLDGFSIGAEAFDEWVVAERHRLDAIATRVSSDLVKQFDQAGDGERAILAMERLVAIDSVDEERHRRLLALEARYRGPDAALARAKELVARLKREVDAEPEAATRAVIDDIKRRLASPPRLALPPETRDRTDLPAPSAAAIGQVEPQRAVPVPWLSRQALLGRPGVGLFAIIALIAAGLLWTLYGRPPAGGGNGQPAVASSTADPWRSPPLPSGGLLGVDRKGIIPIVVLPFKTYQDAESVRMLAEMMTDDLTNMLSRGRNFRVISRQTARSYQMRQIDVADVGKELGVRYALEGSIRVLDNKLRVSVELINAESRSVVWSGRIEREEADRRAAQDEIIARLVRELRIESYPFESARLANDPDADALAYRGMAALHVAFANIGLEAYNKAQALFVEALQRDPQNVAARIGMASYHVNLAGAGLVQDRRFHIDQAMEILAAVIRDHPTIGPAHFQLGIALNADGKHAEAVQAFERALELDASNAGAYAWLGFTLGLVGRPQEGIEHIRYALRLGPKDPSLAFWLQFAGSAELELNRDQQAIDYFQRSIALTPGYPRSWAGLVAAYALAGDLEASRRSVDELRKSSPNLTAQQLYQRFARLSSQSPRLQEGLRLALGTDAVTTKKTWQSPALPSKAADHSIARGRGLIAVGVLPFRSYGENGDDTTVIADMMTDDLTYLLSRISVFRVISSQTAASYRGRNIDVAAIGAELGVDYLVEGNVSTREGLLTVNVALVDAITRLQIWSGRFERTGQDRPSMQREIVTSLARELQVSAIAFENGRTSSDPDVHELIFRGFASIQEARLHGAEALRPAEGHFQKALERDPDAIRAQIGLGTFHAHMAVQLFAPDPAPHLARAEAILQQVINRYPNLSESYQPMGLVHVARGDMDKAAQTFERAIELNPSDAPSHAQLGRALVSLGRAQAGLEHIRYAMQLSPRDPVLGYWLAFAGYAYLELGRYDDAIDHLARAHATNPTQPRTALTLVAALAMAGRMNEARLKLEQVQRTHPHLTRDRIAKMYAGLGGRLHTREGIQRVFATGNAQQPGAAR
ncbi:MAG: tetratricopeptide repeat protein [Xanthobacteraceae bacterium]|nr:tetratricopeptide repeat protein [Xanthobacteraceae bacterium]